MAGETEALLDATMDLLPPLLSALDGLEHAGRHLHPSDLGGLVAALEPFAHALIPARARFVRLTWPEHLAGFRDAVAESSEQAMAALAGFADCLDEANPIMAAYRSLGHAGRAVAALYPVAFMLPPVNRFFVVPGRREDSELLARLAGADPDPQRAGIVHAHNASDQRGGFSVYVPEYYDPEQAYPLVVALHGGSGHGKSFLWTWLRDARSRGVIVVSPTSRESTWSLMQPDTDAPNLDAMVAQVMSAWHVDLSRVLLTGMSDGGTFSYLGGLRDGTAFTHLSPISASFHPVLLQGCSAERLSGLPVYLVHGALDWMFPVDVAHLARDTLTAAGAEVTYRELADLSHTYPREENQRILDWFLTTP